MSGSALSCINVTCPLSPCSWGVKCLVRIRIAPTVVQPTNGTRTELAQGMKINISTLVCTMLCVYFLCLLLPYAYIFVTAQIRESKMEKTRDSRDGDKKSRQYCGGRIILRIVLKRLCVINRVMNFRFL